jgi:hypothetical protein
LIIGLGPDVITCKSVVSWCFYFVFIYDFLVAVMIL